MSCVIWQELWLLIYLGGNCYDQVFLGPKCNFLRIYYLHVGYCFGRWVDWFWTFSAVLFPALGSLAVYFTKFLNFYVHVF